MPFERIGLVGFGEVGRIFGAALAKIAGVKQVSAWDAKWAAASDGPAGGGQSSSTSTSNTETEAEAEAQRLRQFAAATGVRVCDGMQALCSSSDLVISAVTASQTLAVAQQAAPWLGAGQVLLDLNSASPGTKQQAGLAVQANGARYLEAGVMTSVPPHGLAVPMLLGGPHAQALAPALAAWGMNVQVASDELGVASAIKMCRSIMVKGLESLVIESYTTARAYGVEDQMIPTLQETFPGIDWTRQGAYFFSRVAQHGQRRAEEMRESAATVAEVGLAPLMASAIAQRQQTVADEAARGVFASVAKDAPWQAYADALLASNTFKLLQK